MVRRNSRRIVVYLIMLLHKNAISKILFFKLIAMALIEGNIVHILFKELREKFAILAYLRTFEIKTE